MQVHKKKTQIETHARQSGKKMPFLRSQTRGTTNGNAEKYSVDKEKKPLNMAYVKSVTLSENSSASSGSLSMSSPPPAQLASKSSSNTMFPFPPAPILTTTSSSSTANIINISNVSSESSAASESSSVSIRSTSHSNPSSPLLEEYPSQSLNDAMVEDSLVDISRSSSVVLQELTSDHPTDVMKSSTSSIPLSNIQASQAPILVGSLPAFLQQSMNLSTTPPIVYNLVPEQASIQEDRDRALQMVLQQHQCYDDEAGMNMRNQIISELDTLVKQWIRSEGLGKNMAWIQVEQVGGKVVSYGSYKLSVVDKDSDLDLLCVVPKHVSREDFFTNLFDQLAKKKDEVTELRQLSSAFVPVIKMKYRGMEVDLTMARVVCYDRIPEEEDFLLESTITHEMDPRCLRSLNGYRATSEILQLVPNVERFRLTLRVIKLWAKKNGLYGNMLGFLGGASWAILVAKVCQMAGMAAGNMASCTSLIYQFFYTFAHWEWPKPVFIKRVEAQPYPAWNPAINHQDREHAMPIITSSVPQMNSAVNVSKVSCQLIKTKCGEALATMQGIIDGSRTWGDLFQPSNFFEEYEHYIMVMSSCQGDSSLWFGSVEAKLRQLNNHIISSNKVVSARIWPQPFERMDGPSTRQMWFFGVKMMVGQTPEIIQDPLHYFTDLCMSTVPKLGSAHGSTFSVTWQHLPRSNLGKYLSKQQTSMGRSEKLSYAAVTLGQGQGSTMTSPMVLTSMQQTMTSTAPFITNSVPILSPASQGQMSHPPPYNRVFSAPISGLNPAVLPHQNFTYIYSLSAGSQHGPILQGQVINSDQFHNGGGGPPVAGGQKQMTMVSRPPSHMLTFPPNRSHTSPQPGGYPNRPTQSLENMLRSRPVGGNVKSPQTPGGQLQPQRSPGPGSGYVVARHGTSFPHPIPTLTSYPPPPISPMSQFNSPPPPVPKLMPPPASNHPPSALQRSDSSNTQLRSDDLNNLRVPLKRPKDLLPVPDDDARLRSVSNSSDKFPPPSLNRARVTHQDQLPVSPSYTGVTGVVPLPANVDTSVPPPSLPTPPPSLSPPAVSFNIAKKKAFRTGRSPRISVSEIYDMSTPQPVRGCRASNAQIKFSLSSRRADDNVFDNNY